MHRPPWAKLSTPITPKVRDKPLAIRIGALPMVTP
jgi:hypothetical protein